MKTKTLVQLLNEADPSGEIECCVGNVDIHFVERLPGYYDGAYQVLTRDENQKEYYNITGGKYIREGQKIQIHTLSIQDILEDPKATLEYIGFNSEEERKAYEASDNKTKEQWHNIHVNTEWSTFEDWAKKEAAKISGDPGISEYVRPFFDKNIDYNTPLLKAEVKHIDKDGNRWMESVCDRREREWSMKYKVEFEGMDWKISKKETL